MVIIQLPNTQYLTIFFSNRGEWEAKYLPSREAAVLFCFSHYSPLWEWIIPWLKKITWVIGVLRRTVVCDWRFDNLCGIHLHESQVIVSNVQLLWDSESMRLLESPRSLSEISINLLVVYRESVNLIGLLLVDYQLIAYGKIVARVIVWVTLFQTWISTHGANGAPHLNLM